MHLNIFTNATDKAPSIDVIIATHNSFVETFGEVPMTIYFDPHPNTAKAVEYFDNLNRYFDCEIIKTTGLADGYVRSIKNGSDDYLFQLEHDWTFETKFIPHRLSDIIKVMKIEGIYNFRFNKHTNEQTQKLKKWQSFITEKHNATVGMNYCETDNLSNNPHIIDRNKYLTLLDRIKIDQASFGLEEYLTKKDLISCVYGGLGYPATIQHQGKITKKVRV